MSATVAERVAKGAALLDEKRPGWDQRIDLAVLDLESCRDCVVGQLFGRDDSGSFEAGVFALGLDDLNYEEFTHGFDIEDRREFPALTAEWRRIITARRLAMHPVRAEAAS